MVTADSFRQVMRQWASTVTIVTTRFNDEIYGLTATAFSSLSIQPPTVSVSIYRKTHTHPLIESSGIFCVNFLAPDMTHISDRFAGRHPDEDRFHGLAHHNEATGAPVLNDAIAFLDCRVVEALVTGDHTIFIGRVEAATVQKPDQSPLLYYMGSYHTVCSQI
ncbi:MAG: flavin reductase family protein [Chloroflexi bacterium]|nr:flavin reductase family protein [Chloroflexota bacterium]